MFDAIPLPVLITLAILIGFAGLIWSADKFVLGAASLAKVFGLSPLLIGLTIVSFGTSAPEVVVSLSASLKDAGELAIGNAIGSNIANVALVLAVTMLIIKIPVQKHLLFDEVPILVIVTLLAGLFLFDNQLQSWEGWALLLALPAAIAFLVVRKQKDLSHQEVSEETEFESVPKTWAVIWFAVGLIALIASSEILVWGAKETALQLGVSPLIIGLTVIAIGTSLPELAASVMSALKGHHDIALGNIIGSNMFNILAVMSLPGIIQAPHLDSAVFSRDFIAMVVVTMMLIIALLFVLYRNKTRASLGKITGIALLLTYIAYYVVLFIAAS